MLIITESTTKKILPLIIIEASFIAHLRNSCKSLLLSFFSNLFIEIDGNVDDDDWDVVVVDLDEIVLLVISLVEIIVLTGFVVKIVDDNLEYFDDFVDNIFDSRKESSFCKYFVVVDDK
ncbi:hypothetical protein DERP_009011 [Dermatophagoides pteronyssinus]|uniref:Uncharacterized protein n=1 Tax=Dermatophagoides pteronyssinus TaxID=6956 RepID=A0ABQ8JGQ6_DERPT|nr:hypothetical protein DERP_009011 [Dermatophagoides pteronyssinus]